MCKILLSYLVFLSFLTVCFAQNNTLSEIPEKSRFISSDLENFWRAFENMDKISNPFEAYLEKGTEGLKHFIPRRIINADSLMIKVRERKDDYLKFKDFSFNKNEIISHYQSLKRLYPYAKFPPIYFVMGRFSSAGTSKDIGIIIGVEMLEEVDLSFLVIHECVHYQQNKSRRTYNLLEKSIIEGSADFIAELVTGKQGNKNLYDYCEKNKEILLKEFTKEMNGKDFSNWLYNMDNQERPANIGYWVGYKICEAIYNKADDKKLAINRMLNNTDYLTLLKESEILREYMIPKVVGLHPFENNTTNVDFQLSELSINFSHRMKGSSFKPIREKGVKFPLKDIIGYDNNNRTFKLLIELEPNTEYAFKITGRGFINEYGFPIEDYEVRFKTKQN